MRRFYNGYRFSMDESKVYNPYGMLKHFQSTGDFEDYWYETATPTFLIKLVEQRKLDVDALDKPEVKLRDFAKYDIESMLAVPVLYQTGYLTITDYDEETQVYSLDFPNDEVRSAFADTLVNHYLAKGGPLKCDLTDAFKAGRIEEVMRSMGQFLVTIPYNLTKAPEQFFHVVVLTLFKALKLDCQAEATMSSGSADMVVKIGRFGYCFEFKVDRSVDEALRQIKKKGYALPLKGEGRKVFEVGVKFDSEKKTIVGWSAECNGVEVAKMQIEDAVVVRQAAQTTQVGQVRRTRTRRSAKLARPEGQSKFVGVGSERVEKPTEESMSAQTGQTGRSAGRQKRGDSEKAKKATASQSVEREDAEKMGEARGVRRSLLMLLNARFGQLPESLLAQVNTAPLQQLEDWMKRGGTKTLEEIFSE
jgi:hypothetical protein